jgi:hypothetical protein
MFNSPDEGSTRLTCVCDEVRCQREAGNGVLEELAHQVPATKQQQQQNSSSGSIVMRKTAVKKTAGRKRNHPKAAVASVGCNKAVQGIPSSSSTWPNEERQPT